MATLKPVDLTGPILAALVKTLDWHDIHVASVGLDPSPRVEGEARLLLELRTRAGDTLILDVLVPLRGTVHQSCDLVDEPWDGGPCVNKKPGAHHIHIELN